MNEDTRFCGLTDEATLDEIIGRKATTVDIWCKTDDDDDDDDDEEEEEL